MAVADVTVHLCAGAESVVVEISDGDQQSSDGTQTWPMRGHRRKPSRGPELPVLDQLPVSVLFDMRYVSMARYDLGIMYLIVCVKPLKPLKPGTLALS